MKILLTGATGFLGSALAKYWVQAGHDLTLLVRSTSSLQRVQSLLPTAKLATWSLADSDVVRLVRETSPDMIVHAACAYGRQGESVLQIFDTNIRLGMLLLDAVRANGRKRVGFINTGTALDSMTSNYALSKQQFAQWGDMLARQHPDALQFVNIRLQHMYGPGDDRSKFPTLVLHACQHHDPRLALTAGEQRRDFIYIDDVVSAYDVVAQNLHEFALSDQVDLGSGYAPTVRSFVEQIHSLTGSRTELQFGAVPYRENETMLCLADIRRLVELGWKPAYSLDQGIRKTIELEFNR